MIFLMVLILLLAVLLILVILIQPSKGDMLGSSFGGAGGAMSSMFGSRGSLQLLHKITIGITALVVVLSIVMNILTPSNATVENVKAVSEGVKYNPELEAPTEAPATIPAGNQNQQPTESGDSK